MTLLALPKPGPPPFFSADSVARLSRRRMFDSDSPSSPRPPTRSRSRRVTPSQVSRLAKPGMTSMVFPLGEIEFFRRDDRRRGGREYRHLIDVSLTPERGSRQQDKRFWLATLRRNVWHFTLLRSVANRAISNSKSPCPTGPTSLRRSPS